MSADVTRTLLHALDFAARRHRDQRRKGALAEPYINHPITVASLLADAGLGDDLVLICGALLHDTVEDTDATLDDVQGEFGDDVASLVAEVTDEKGLSASERRRAQIAQAGTLSRRGRLLKIADKISNLRDLLVKPPTRWTDARKLEYVRWAYEVWEAIRGESPMLDALFEDVYADGMATFGSDEDD